MASKLINALAAKAKAIGKEQVSKAKANPKGIGQQIKDAVKKEAKKAVIGAAVGVAFGLTLRTTRKAMGFTQQQVADATFTSRRAVNGWEAKGARAPKWATQLGIMAMLAGKKGVDKARGR